VPPSVGIIMSNCGDKMLPVDSVIMLIVMKLIQSNGESKSGPGEGLPGETVNRDLDYQISLVKVLTQSTLSSTITEANCFVPLLPVRAHNSFQSS
jgi:hypothetical protein